MGPVDHDDYQEKVIEVGLSYSFKDLRKQNINSVEELVEKLDFPNSIRGTSNRYEIHYELEGRIQLLNTTDRYDPLINGISIGHTSTTAGTLGGVVWDNETGEKYLLSNTHVFTAETSDYFDTEIGDPILQPGPFDGGRHPEDIAGTLKRFAWERENCDAAIATIERDINLNEYYHLGEIDSPGSIEQTSLTEHMQIEKVGRTTGYTTGEIEATTVNIVVQVNEDTLAFFENVIETKTGDFSSPGDSGARVWLKDDKSVVGLVFAGSENHSYIIPADRIEEELNVSFNQTIAVDDTEEESQPIEKEPIVLQNEVESTAFEYTITKENRDTFTMNRRMQYDGSHELSDDAKLDPGVGITGVGEAIIELKTDGKYKVEDIEATTEEESEPMTATEQPDFHKFLHEVI